VEDTIPQRINNLQKEKLGCVRLSSS